jgi:hypothetical protein
MTYATKRQAATPDKQERQQDSSADLGSYLEHDQFVADTERPVPRAQLSRRAATALWALRIFVIVVGAMVVYSFFSQLGS